MRKYTKANGTFYYPEWRVDLIDTEELKIIVENPVGYVEGDSVRIFYTFASDNIQVGVNAFEMFSPLVKDGPILRAIFYLPLSAEFTNGSNSFSSNLKEVEHVVKTKGSTDFYNYTNVLDKNTSFLFLTTRSEDVRSNPIPVFFFSERGAGLFENTILNRQDRVADTNFSSVAIRQDKFNPFVMDIGGRNLISNIPDNWAKGYYSSATGSPVLNGPNHNLLKERMSCEPNSYYTMSSPKRMIALQYDVDDVYIPPIIDKGTNKTLIFKTHSSARYLRFNILFAEEPNELNLISEYKLKLEKGSIATAWTPAPEDYEVTEVVSGADLAGGLAKFDASYAFKLLDDSEWVTKKLICPENYIQLFWGEPRSETRFSFWFKIKEIEKSSEAWGEVEHYRELRAGTDVKERRKEVTKYRFPKTKLRLTSGVFRQDIIDKLKGISHSTTIYKYNPYTKLNEGTGVVAQVTELRNHEDLQTPQLGTGHFKLSDIYTYSNTIEELINSPESFFDLEFTFKGTIAYVHFIQNRDDESGRVLISNTITESDFTKKTYTNSIVIDRSKKVKPVLRFRVGSPDGLTEIKDIYIKGSLGGIEDVEVEIATMNIIPHQDGESEMELTVISDDFRKPDYLYF